MHIIMMSIGATLLGIISLWVVGFAVGVYAWLITKGFKTGYNFMNNTWKKPNAKT